MGPWRPSPHGVDRGTCLHTHLRHSDRFRHSIHRWDGQFGDQSHMPIVISDWTEDFYAEPNAILPGSVFSTSVKWNLLAGGDLPGYVFIDSVLVWTSIWHYSTRYEFTMCSPEGIVLILPRGATFHDLLSKTQFCKLAIQHASNQYCFTTWDCHRQLSNHSLYLITLLQAHCWSLASFQGASPGVDALIMAVRIPKGMILEITIGSPLFIHLIMFV